MTNKDTLLRGEFVFGPPYNHYEVDEISNKLRYDNYITRDTTIMTSISSETTVETSKWEIERLGFSTRFLCYDDEIIECNYSVEKDGKSVEIKGDEIPIRVKVYQVYKL